MYLFFFFNCSEDFICCKGKDHWRSSKAKGLSSAAEDAHKETEKEVKDMGVVFGREADIRLIQKAWQLQ